MSMHRTYVDLFPQTIITSLVPNEYREKLQKKRLKKLVDYAKKNSPFFSELYKGIGSDYKLTDLPPVTKRQMMDNFDSYLTERTMTKAEVEKFLRETKDYSAMLRGKYILSTTSGSTGLQAYVINDQSAQNIMTAIVCVRAHHAQMPYAMLCMKDSFGIDYSTAIDSARKIPFLNHFLGIFEAKKHVSELAEELNKFNPRVLVGYTGSLMLLTEDAYVDKLHIHPKLVLTSGEYLSDYCRKRLEETFKCPVHSMYACTEGGFLAFECKKNHLHINNDWIILEPVDDELNPVPDGTLAKRTLLTYLGNKLQPIIRYELTDRTILHNETCECGRRGPWIEVEGRTNDILHFEDGKGGIIKVAPMSIEDIIEETPGVQFFQFVLRGGNQIELRLVPNQNDDINEVFSRIEKRVTDYLKYSNIENASISLSDKRPQRNTVSGKFKQVYQEE